MIDKPSRGGFDTEVYHAKNPTFGFGTSPVTWPDDFDLVALVDGDDLDDAFERTNNIDTPWMENVGVKVVKPSRSTSAGDVVVDSHGDVFVCLPLGWRQVGKSDKAIRFMPGELG